MKKITGFFTGTLLLALVACSNDQPAHSGETGRQDTTPPSTASNEANKSISYKTYCNGRYGFCIAYPEGILYPMGESGSGDGEAFKSKDGDNTLLAYRDFRDNIDPDRKFTLSSAYQQDLRPDEGDTLKKEITYKKLAKDFYVISGYHGNKIFYQKTMMADSQLVTCILEYKAAEKALYDRISEEVSRSFK